MFKLEDLKELDRRSTIKIVGYSLSLLICSFLGYGWIMNIIAIAGSSFDPLTGTVILRIIGVFIPPLGAVMGFL